MKTYLGLLTRASIVAAAFVLSAWSAEASTLIDFQGALGGNPADTYTEDGYIFQPNSATNDTKCFDGQCLKEFHQGTVTTMVREGGGQFDLLGFYFVIVGNGNTPTLTNNVTVTGTFLNLTTKSLTFTLGDLLTGIVNASLSRHDGTAVVPNDKITKNDGFVVSVLNGLFNGVTKVSWTTNTGDLVCTGPKKTQTCKPADAQARLDNVVADHLAYDPPSAVPLPGGIWLLLSGLAGMAALGRARKAA